MNKPRLQANDVETITCKMCNVVCQGEISWVAHLEGKKHKHNEIMLIRNSDASETMNEQSTPVVPTNLAESQPFPMTNNLHNFNLSSHYRTIVL